MIVFDCVCAQLKKESRTWVKEFKTKHSVWAAVYTPLIVKPG